MARNQVPSRTSMLVALILVAAPLPATPFAGAMMTYHHAEVPAAIVNGAELIGDEIILVDEEQFYHFDPATGASFTSTGNLPEGYCESQVTTNGTHLFVIGGRECNFLELQTTVYAYDPSSQTVEQMDVELPYGIADGDAVYDGDGNIYIFVGGEETDNILKYDIDQFEVIGSGFDTPFQTQVNAEWAGDRAYMTSAAGDDWLYVFKPGVGVFDTNVTLPADRYGEALAYLGDQLYILGGTPGQGNTAAQTTVYAYDGNQLTTHPDTLRDPRTRGHAVVVGDTILYLGGLDDTPQDRSEVLVFEPTSDAVVAASQLRPYTMAAGSAWAAGRVVVVGGETGACTTFCTPIQVFDPVADTVTVTPSPIAARLSYLAVAAAQGKVFIFGGREGTTYSDEIHRYDPATGTFETLLTRLPAPRAGMGVASTGNEIFLFGGYGVGGASSFEVLRFNPTNEVLTISTTSAPGAGDFNAVWGDGLIYLHQTYNHDIWTFDPDTEEVLTVQDILPRNVGFAPLVWGGGDLYLLGGFDPVVTDQVAHILRLDTDTAQAVHVDNLYNPTWAHTAVNAGGSTVVLGGVETGAGQSGSRITLFDFGAPAETAPYRGPSPDPLTQQSDAGTEGDASDDASNPTVLNFDGDKVHLFGALDHNGDERDAYGFEMGTGVLSFEITLEAAQLADIRIELRDPNGSVRAFSDRAGLGGSETVSYDPPGDAKLHPGQWTVIVDLVNATADVRGVDFGVQDPPQISGVDIRNGAFRYDGDGERRCEPYCQVRT